MDIINTKILSNWENWIRVPIMAIIGLSLIALVSGRLHTEKENDNGE